MKKQFKTAVIAIALMASATMVFASDIANVFTGKVLVDYYWQKFLPDGVTPDGDPILGTDAENPYASQCPNIGITRCAEGTPVIPGTGPVHTVYYSF